MRILCNAKDSHILSTKITVYIVFVNFNESLTNDVINFEQLGPGHWPCCLKVELSFQFNIHAAILCCRLININSKATFRIQHLHVFQGGV